MFTSLKPFRFAHGDDFGFVNVLISKPNVDSYMNTARSM
jgi:hypothetical protein